MNTLHWSTDRNLTTLSPALHSFYPSLLSTAAYQKIDNEKGRFGDRGGPEGTLLQRLWAAHLNHCESFAPFAASVAAASSLAAPTKTVAELGMAHLLCRVVHYVAYVFNIPNLRTIAYMGSAQASGWIFAVALFGPGVIRGANK